MYSFIELFPNLTFLSIRQIKKLPGSNPLFRFLAHARAADACTELIELAFETNKLPIGKGIGGKQAKTNGAIDLIKLPTMNLSE